MALTVANLAPSIPTPIEVQAKRSSRSSLRERTASSPTSDMLIAQTFESVPCLPLRSR